MDFVLSPKKSTIPDDEISLETLATIWNGKSKEAFIREMNAHRGDSCYTKINQDTFLGYVYGNIIYFHASVVPKMVKAWPDEQLVGFYNEDDLDEIVDNFSKEFNALIGDKPYKIKKTIVLTRSLEDRFLELLSLFPSKELITKLNYCVQENRVNHILQIQPALKPSTYFDYRMGSPVSAYESHLKFMTMFPQKLKDAMIMYYSDYPQEIDFLKFVMDFRLYLLDSALKYYFATAVLNYDEIHYIFDLSSDYVNHSMTFSNKRIGEVEIIKFKDAMTPTYVFNLALEMRKLTYAESKEVFESQLDKVIDYFQGDKCSGIRSSTGCLVNEFIRHHEPLKISPYVNIISTKF